MFIVSSNIQISAMLSCLLYVCAGIITAWANNLPRICEENDIVSPKNNQTVTHKICTCSQSDKVLEIGQDFLSSSERLKRHVVYKDKVRHNKNTDGTTTIGTLFYDKSENGRKEEINPNMRRKKEPDTHQHQYKWFHINISDCDAVDIQEIFLIKSRELNFKIHIKNVKSLKLPDFLKERNFPGLKGNPLPDYAEISIQNTTVNSDLSTSLGERHRKVHLIAVNATINGGIKVRSKTEEQELHIMLGNVNIKHGIINEVWGQQKSQRNTIEIKESVISQFSNNILHNMDKFELVRNRIGNMNQGALAFNGTSKAVTIEANQFTTSLSTGFIIFNNPNGEVVFEHNNVTKLKPGAFHELCQLKRITFKYNHIHFAKTGSLNFGNCPSARSVEREILGNTFHCGCNNLDWLYTATNEYIANPKLAEVFKIFINTSKCEDEHQHYHGEEHIHKDEWKEDKEEMMKLPPTHKEYQERFSSLCLVDEEMNAWEILPVYAKIAIPVVSFLLFLLVLCIGVKLYIKKNKRDLLERVSLHQRLNSARASPQEDYPLGSNHTTPFSDHLDLLLNRPPKSHHEITDVTDIGSQRTGSPYDTLGSNISQETRSVRSQQGQNSMRSQTSSASSSLNARRPPEHVLRSINRDKSNHFAQIVELNVPEETASTLKRASMNNDNRASNPTGWVDAKNEFT